MGLALGSKNLRRRGGAFRWGGLVAASSLAAVAFVGGACRTQDDERIGTLYAPLAREDDGFPPPPDLPPQDCRVTYEGEFVMPDGSQGPRGLLLIVSTYDMGGTGSAFDLWRAARWASVLGTYQSRGCPADPQRLVICGWRPNSTVFCQFIVDAPMPPECDATRPCTGPSEECLEGRCQQICRDPCQGRCGEWTDDCGTTLDCGGCERGSCATSHVCIPECSAEHSDICAYGVCNTTTQRCEPGCTSTAECPDLETVCNTDIGDCVRSCNAKHEEPPGPGYDCVLGVWRQQCSAENPCPDASSECRDGYCFRARCGEGGTCPEGRTCDRSGDCIRNPTDPCAGVVCPLPGQTCQDGACVGDDPCAGCVPPSQCVNGACVEPSGCGPCPPGSVCQDGICQLPGGCTWDFDCGLGEVCVNGQCIDVWGDEDTCVLDGQCDPDETCACDIYCCGGETSGAGSGGVGSGGEICTYSGSGEITYEQCFACGGSVRWHDAQAVCELAI